MQFLHFLKIFVVKSLHNVEATDFFYKSELKKGKIC